MSNPTRTSITPQEINPDEKELLEAVEKLEAAKLNNEKATKEILENANEYVKEDLDEEKLIEVAREAQMANSKAWYKFWETATKIPKDNRYETYTTNEKRTWKTIVKANEEFLREAVSEGGIEGVTWKKSMKKKDVDITYSPEKSEVFKTRMYKVVTTLKDVSPRLVLLALVRGPVAGSGDSNIVYFREHYNFVGGSTSLVHQVRKVVNDTRLAPRDFFDLTHWSEEEDGSIFYTASSVKAFPTLLPGVTRGATLFKGVHLQPTEDGNVKLTMISEVNPKGWALSSYLNWFVPYALQSEVLGLQKSCDIVKDEGNEDRCIRKFVLRELDVDKED